MLKNLILGTALLVVLFAVSGNCGSLKCERWPYENVDGVCENNLPTQEPIRFAAFEGYKGQWALNGTSCINNNVSADPICHPGFMVIDEANKRMFLDMGDNGGQYWMFENETFIILPTVPQMEGKCTILPNFGYPTQVRNYRRAFSVDSCNRTFVGAVWDVGSCTWPIPVRMVMERVIKNNKRYTVLGEWDWQQDFPVKYPLGNGAFADVCVHTSGRIVMDTATLNVNPSTFGKYFQLPTKCNKANVIDYCTSAYYPGSQCSPFITA